MAELILPIIQGGGIDTDEATALPEHVLYPYTAGTRGSDELTQGTIPTVDGKVITPKSTSQIAIVGKTYAAGDIVVAGEPNLIASNIKKGVTIMGITGTFEGYVPTPTDLYLYGQNLAGFYGGYSNSGDDWYTNFAGPSFDARQMTFTSKSSTTIRANLNMSGRSYLNFYVYCSSYTGKATSINTARFNGNGIQETNLKMITQTLSAGNYYTVSIPLAGYQINAHILITFAQFIGNVQRIYYT